jgi:hypothetical protein
VIATLSRPRMRLKAPGDALERLIGLSLVGIQGATGKLTAGGPLKAWRAEMERTIATAYQATYITATAQRLGVPADSPLISRSRLSRAEREDIRRAVAGQLAYLDRFAADVAAGKLSPAQIAARANLYGPALKSFYYAQRYGEWEIPSQLLPGNNACLGNCRCTGSITADNGDGTGVWTRVLGGELHCDECPRLAGDHPVKRRRA